MIMTADQNINKEIGKCNPKFANFGEYLFWSYARSALPLCPAKNLFEWYCEVRKEWPPLNILIHYLKNIYLYSIENGLMDKHAEELEEMDLPFKWQYIPLDYPQPELYI